MQDKRLKGIPTYVLEEEYQERTRPEKKCLMGGASIEPCAYAVWEFLEKYLENSPSFAPFFLRKVFETCLDWVDTTPFVTTKREEELAEFAEKEGKVLFE